jgi:hypothetical protein
MPPDHSALTAHDVLAHSGWHPRYTRVLAVASDGDYGFALVDGNGDGAELETEIWLCDDGTWTDHGSSGAGPLSTLPPLLTWEPCPGACYAYGRAPGRRPIIISFEGHQYRIPVSEHGAWAFVKIRTDPCSRELPSLTA